MFHFNDKTYQIVHEHKDAWNAEAFRERYSEVLDRYDYIVGDWGYSQLRLKGFYKDNSPKANRDTTIYSLQDYLNEYCNFGCAYFIIERVSSSNRVVATTPDGLERDSEDEAPEGEQQEGLKLPTVGENAPEVRFLAQRPEHRDNRHRYDQSMSRMKAEQAKNHDNNPPQDSNQKRENNGRNQSSNRQDQGQRRDQNARNNNGNGNRSGGNGYRNDQGPRGVQAVKGNQDSRPDQPNRTEQGTRPDPNFQGESRGRNRDRKYRGGNGQKSDRPFENKNGEGKPKVNHQSGNHPSANQPARNNQANHSNKGQAKDRAPIV
jgi:uncharacterized protein YutD